MKDYKEYAKHIFDEIVFIEKNCFLLAFDAYLKDEILQRATVRSIEIIGEAVKNIPSDITKKYPDTEWKNIARARDKLIHHYFGVDYYLIWDIIRVHLPKLKKDIEKIISE